MGSSEQTPLIRQFHITICIINILENYMKRVINGECENYSNYQNALQLKSLKNNIMIRNNCQNDCQVMSHAQLEGAIEIHVTEMERGL